MADEEKDPVRELLRSLIPRRKMNEVSRRIGKNQTYIQQFLTYGQPKRLPEEVRVALARLYGRSPDDFRPPEEREQMPQLVLDPALELRAKAVAERFVGPEDNSVNRQLRADIAWTVYALLEAEQKGVRITDNEHTLRAIELLISRIAAS
jgi:hypothetical protein